MAQEPVLAREVLTRADPGQKGREQKPRTVPIWLSIAAGRPTNHRIPDLLVCSAYTATGAAWCESK
jgi:hypothetical protein